MKQEEMMKISKFNGSNWYEFESDMMYHLMAKELWAVVSNQSKNEKLIFDKIAEVTWTDRNMQAIGIIVSRVEQELRESIRGLRLS